MLVQERAELFNRSKLRAKGEGRPCLGLQEILEVVIDFPEKAGVVLSRFQRDFESERGFRLRKHGGSGNICGLFHEPSGRVEGVVGSKHGFRKKTVGVGRIMVMGLAE